MKKPGGGQSLDRRFAVMRRLFNLNGPATFNDIGYLCGPDTIKTLAANGYISVEIRLKPKGIADYQQGVLLRKKRERLKPLRPKENKL